MRDDPDGTKALYLVHEQVKLELREKTRTNERKDFRKNVASSRIFKEST